MSKLVFTALIPFQLDVIAAVIYLTIANFLIAVPLDFDLNIVIEDTKRQSTKPNFSALK